jgi:MoaA/NifB/PqqE/SkfB family radical SAM enzyme
MDLAAKLANPGIHARADQWRRGDDGLAIVELDPTTFCDLACPTCVSQGVLGKGRFTREQLFVIADDLANLGVVGIILIGGGEPLMHPATVELLGHLTESGLAVGLVTNGTRLVDHAVVQQVAKHCSWVRVSVDAATRETYESLRPALGGRNAFDDVLDGLRSLNEQRKTCSAGFSFVVHQSFPDRRGNLHEVSAAAHLAKDLGCNYVEFKAEVDVHHRVIPLGESDTQSLIGELAEARTHIDDDFVVEVSSSLRALLAREPVTGQVKSYSTCPTTALRTTISSSGVFVCAYHRGDERFSYGDPTTLPFKALWAGRRDIVNPENDCHFHCARHELNLVLMSNKIPTPDRSAQDPFI